MSRVSPYSATPRSTRPIADYGDTQSTRPLEIGRSIRPSTPTSSVFSNGPSRPQRSGLRARQTSISSIDSQMSPLSAASPGASTTMHAALSALQSAGRRRRAMTAGSEDAEWERQRTLEQEAERQLQKRIKDRVPQRRAKGKAKAGDIDAVLDQIQDEWEPCTSPDFSPVDLALELFNESSTGKDMRSFQSTKRLLFDALKGSVDKNYQAFAAALPHHASMLIQLDNTQLYMKGTRAALTEAKETLGNKRADLLQMWSRRQTLEEMTRILDQIEHLKSVPDALESLISEKRLLQAAILLVRSLKTVRNSDMMEIGAVTDLRNYLVSQEPALREILIDELHSHLYLKSVFTNSRWAAYTPSQQTLPKTEYDLELPESVRTALYHDSESTENLPDRYRHFLAELAVRPNDSPLDVEDHRLRHSTSASSPAAGAGFVSSSSNFAGIAASQNKSPESDSFAYMGTLLESLAVLGKLGSALDAVAQRLPQEIYALVESTLDEVSERADYLKKGSLLDAGELRTGTEDIYVVSSGPNPANLGLLSSTAHTLLLAASKTRGALLSPSSLRLAALEASTKQIDHEILKDFFWTLYSKFDAVSQGLGVVSEVANRIGSRRDFKDSSGAKPGQLFPLSEIAVSLHAEIRTLLFDYLTDEEQGSVSGRNPLASINEVLREGKFGRDRSKNVFRFADGDVKLTNKALRAHEGELNRVLKDTVPGLVPGSAEASVQATLSAAGTDDHLTNPGKHHRLLIKPDAFHVGVLFQPTLAFLQRIADVIPSGMDSTRASSAVMDDFVLKVYLPQLQEKVTELFLHSVNGIYAFQPDTTTSRLSHQPLIKATTQLMALINSLCAMLRTSPFHKENYSRLILTVVVEFYQRCSTRFQELILTGEQKTTDANPKVALAADWAQRPDLHPCLSEIFKISEINTPKKDQLYRQETHLELNFVGEDGTVEKNNLIGSTRNLAILGSLYTSLRWFTEALDVLKAVPEIPLSPTTPLRLIPMSAVTPYTAGDSFLRPFDPSEPLQLPLSKEMSLRFNSLFETYKQLAEWVLFTIRMDIRCHAIYHLVLSMRHGNYNLEREASEPDPHIVDLNSELTKCEGHLSTAVGEREHAFAFEGIGQLLEHLLVSEAKRIRLANANGIRKMIRNILALQQSIKTLTSDTRGADFDRAKRYYTLFFRTPTELIESIKFKQEFAFEEYHVMLKLMCGVDQTTPNAGPAQAADRSYGMHVIELQQLEMESANEDYQ
ncbi:hypothetical protein BDM02DRAFT_3223223 [Thelephora ganbajun]|uniref:Uncharacterized protein n=1 Tax=Thelephora ganbajun TaxID=370292 RepID=A0ACB6ZLS2_THEGA|nr:hypothetical protein BDM02DRAFT_3223223 [Thelephora ganbajun]